MLKIETKLPVLQQSSLVKELDAVLITGEEKSLTAKLGLSNAVLVGYQSRALLRKDATWEGERNVLWIHVNGDDVTTVHMRRMRRTTTDAVVLADAVSYRVLFPELTYGQPVVWEDTPYNEYGFVTALENEFMGLVGALSEAVNDCSYNDDSILCSLLYGTLNQEVQNKNNAYGPNSNRSRIESETGYPVETDYESLLMGYIVQTGGWPAQYGGPVIPLKMLHQLAPLHHHYFEAAGRMDVIERYSRPESPATVDEYSARVAQAKQYEEFNV